MLIVPIRTHTSQAEQDQPARGRLPRFGVALFDESRDSGWACLVDSQPFRFRQPQDLPNDCIWVCSMGGAEFRSRWGTMRHLRSADYVSKLHHLAGDYGLRVDGEGRFGHLAQQAAARLAPAIHRAVLMAAQVYGWTDPSQLLRADSLAEDIRQCLVEPPPVRNHLRGALAAAYQNYTCPTWGGYRGEPDSITLTLRYNRLEYARRLMAIDVPDGAWSQHGDARAGCRYPLEKALDPQFPCLVNATVEFIGKDQEIAALCGFGSQPNRRTVLRSWISQPELLWLVKHAHVHVSSAHVAACGKPLPANARLPELLTADPLWTLSVPAGLVAEAHWKALGSPIYNARAGGEKKDHTVWAVWLRATDRAISFELALAAHHANFYVTGYGNGAVTVRCQRDQLPALLEFCQEHGINHPAFQSILAEHGLLPD